MFISQNFQKTPTVDFKDYNSSSNLKLKYAKILVCEIQIRLFFVHLVAFSEYMNFKNFSFSEKDRKVWHNRPKGFDIN